MNYTWTKELCGHSEVQPLALLDPLVTTTSVDSCTLTTLVLSIILCVCGVITNLINILAFTCNSEVRDDKTPYLVTIVVSDLIFLLINLPYFILQTGYIHLDQTQYQQHSTYIGIRYALSFILICASSWMLVALVTKKILSSQIEGDATSIKPIWDFDQAADGTEQETVLSKSSSICVVAIPVVATFLHGVKLFEYQTGGDSHDTPWLMKKRLTGLGYELYTVTVNVAVTMLAPYMFLLCSTVYYAARVVMVMMRRKGEREPTLDVCLLSLLGVFHLVCYGGSVYPQTIRLHQRKQTTTWICIKIQIYEIDTFY